MKCAVYSSTVEFLDLELKEEDLLLKQKDDLHKVFESAAPERVQEIARILESAIPASEGSNKRGSGATDF